MPWVPGNPAPETIMRTQQSTSGQLSSDELAIMSLAFASQPGEGSVRPLLRQLNAMTTHRFTGVYRFEPGWVVSVALWDRSNPDLAVSADVKMQESYCWLTGLGKETYVIEDACLDSRLDGHAAQQTVRAYVSVVLRDRAGKPWGTLCHFDFDPRPADARTLRQLEFFRPLVEEVVVRDTNSLWDPEASAEARRVVVNRES